MKKYVVQLGILLVITMILGGSAGAADTHKLVLLYTGDNWGHVDPCG